MQLHHCQRCGHRLAFSAQRCDVCSSEIGYVPQLRGLRSLTPPDGAGVYDAEGDRLWRCLNAAWGCNWMLSAGSDTEWCRSCRLTRGRPDLARVDAVAAWVAAEAAKRQLVHQLDKLELPIVARSADAPDGLAFDLVDVPGHAVVTGHLDGVVTLDLAETDDRYRDDLRRTLCEPFRTVIGHLRHEVAHYYWPRLVGQTNEVGGFRRLFGDERDDYRQAMDRYYAGGAPAWSADQHITPYAASHPFEDWAETFAHYLHIIYAAETAIAHRFMPDGADVTIEQLVEMPDFAGAVATWRQISAAVNDISESLGNAAVYPLDPVGVVVDKLNFVHRQVTAHGDRHHFYAQA